MRAGWCRVVFVVVAASCGGACAPDPSAETCEVNDCEGFVDPLHDSWQLCARCDEEADVCSVRFVGDDGEPFEECTSPCLEDCDDRCNADAVAVYCTGSV